MQTPQIALQTCRMREVAEGEEAMKHWYQWVANIIAGFVLFSMMLVAIAVCKVFMVCFFALAGETEE